MPVHSVLGSHIYIRNTSNDMQTPDSAVPSKRQPSRWLGYLKRCRQMHNECRIPFPFPMTRRIALPHALCSHHHQLRCSPLSHQPLPVSRVQTTIACSHTIRGRRTNTRPTHARLSTHGLQRMALTVHLPSNLKVIIRKHHPALNTSKASRVILAIPATAHRARTGLKVLALDTAIATCT